MAKPIYLDYAAATPLDKRVFAAMRPYFEDQFYNPSSSYMAAKFVREALENARAQVAHWLGAKRAEVIFTAGATESIYMALQGVMAEHPNGHIVTSAIEHPAVLQLAKRHSHSIAGVGKDGLLDMQSVKSAITDTTVLVSIGLANNELGTLQPLRAIAAYIKELRQLRRLKNNPNPLYLHTDASQAGCYMDLHVERLGVDLLTLNGGKMYGPKQSGILYIRAGTHIAPLIVGGGQESGMRAGTENVAACIGFAEAFANAQKNRKQAVQHTQKLRDKLQLLLTNAFPKLLVNGSKKHSLPNILHVSWPGIDGERLLMLLDENGVMASTGSACAANKQTASYVLQACQIDNSAIQGSLRLSIGLPTTQRDIKQAATRIIAAMHSMEKI